MDGRLSRFGGLLRAPTVLIIADVNIIPRKMLLLFNKVVAFSSLEPLHRQYMRLPLVKVDAYWHRVVKRYCAALLYDL